MKASKIVQSGKLCKAVADAAFLNPSGDSIFIRFTKSPR